MKKALSLLLVFVMLMSLCACGNDDTQTAEPSTAPEQTIDSTQQTTDSTEGTTAPTDELTTAPTEAPTTPPTQAPTEAPATPAACSHSYTDATCTAAKTCTKCGATEGGAAGHNWAAATCTAAKTCTRCGATEGGAAGHSWKDATCAAPKTCTVCGATEGGTTSHTLTATCTICGQVNEGYLALHIAMWNYVVEKGDGRLTAGTFNFYDLGDERNVEIGYSHYMTIEKFAQEYNMTLDEIRAEYEPMEMIKTINGKECIYDGWGMENYSRRQFKEENGIVTIEFLSLDWDEYDEEVWTLAKTVVLQRTALNELTIISSDHDSFPVGLKLVGKSHLEG